MPVLPLVSLEELDANGDDGVSVTTACALNPSRARLRLLAVRLVDRGVECLETVMLAVLLLLLLLLGDWCCWEIGVVGRLVLWRLCAVEKDRIAVRLVLSNSCYSRVNTIQ